MADTPPERTFTYEVQLFLAFVTEKLRLHKSERENLDIDMQLRDQFDRLEVHPEFHDYGIENFRAYWVRLDRMIDDWLVRDWNPQAYCRPAINIEEQVREMMALVKDVLNATNIEYQEEMGYFWGKTPAARELLYMVQYCR